MISGNNHLRLGKWLQHGRNGVQATRSLSAGTIFGCKRPLLAKVGQIAAIFGWQAAVRGWNIFPEYFVPDNRHTRAKFQLCIACGWENAAWNEHVLHATFARFLDGIFASVDWIKTFVRAMSKAQVHWLLCRYLYPSRCALHRNKEIICHWKNMTSSIWE